MAASKASLKITDLYRTRVFAIRARAQQIAERNWQDVNLADLEGSFATWHDQAVRLVTTSQEQALRATAGYLTAFLSSELGSRVSPISLDTSAYVGKARDGRSLADAFVSPLIGIKVSLKAGKGDVASLQFGKDRAIRAVGFDLDQASRVAMLNVIDADDRFDGWRRAIKGTCGACAGVAEGLSHALWFPVHPNCECVSEPNVAGVSNHFPRLTGTAIFAAKTPQEQDDALGPEAGQRFRDGLPLSALVGHSAMENQHDLLTQKPLDAVAGSPTG